MKYFAFIVGLAFLQLSCLAGEEPTVLNPAQYSTLGLSCEIVSTINSLSNYHVITTDGNEHTPTLIGEKFIGNAQLNIHYKRFKMGVGYYQKSVPVNGEYLIDKTNWIYGYDPGLATIETYRMRSVQLGLNSRAKSWGTVSFEVNFIPLSLSMPYYRIFVSREYTNFTYQIGIACPSFYFIPWPATVEVSTKTKLPANMYVLGEFQVSRTAEKRSQGGYVVLAGLGKEILDGIHVALFYQLYHNNGAEKLTFPADDHRIGFQLAYLSRVDIIHGKGTGALKQLVQELLTNHKSVREFRLAGQDKGGAGATVVYLE